MDRPLAQKESPLSHPQPLTPGPCPPTSHTPTPRLPGLQRATWCLCFTECPPPGHCLSSIWQNPGASCHFLGFQKFKAWIPASISEKDTPVSHRTFNLWVLSQSVPWKVGGQCGWIVSFTEQRGQCRLDDRRVSTDPVWHCWARLLRDTRATAYRALCLCLCFWHTLFPCLSFFVCSRGLCLCVSVSLSGAAALCHSLGTSTHKRHLT